jgi:hypothetical protein
LLERGIGTQNHWPILKISNSIWASYYNEEHLEANLLFRELGNPRLSDNENILRQFTKFTFDLHEKLILRSFSGNTLIKKEEKDSYSFI